MRYLILIMVMLVSIPTQSQSKLIEHTEFFVSKYEIIRVSGDLFLGERADLYVDGSLFVDGTIYVKNKQSDVRVFGSGEIISRRGMNVEDSSKFIVGNSIYWNMLVDELHPFINLNGLKDNYVVSYFNFDFTNNEVNVVSRCYNHNHDVSLSYLNGDNIFVDQYSSSSECAYGFINTIIKVKDVKNKSINKLIVGKREYFVDMVEFNTDRQYKVKLKPIGDGYYGAHIVVDNLHYKHNQIEMVIKMEILWLVMRLHLLIT